MKQLLKKELFTKTKRTTSHTKRNYKFIISDTYEIIPVYEDLYTQKLNEQFKIIKTNIRRKRTRKEISNALKLAALKTNTFRGLINGNN